MGMGGGGCMALVIGVSNRWGYRYLFSARERISREGHEPDSTWANPSRFLPYFFRTLSQAPRYSMHL